MLCNYVKRVVLPALGLQGTYQENEDVDEAPKSAPPTHKRPLDLGESVVHGLYKKLKVTTPTPPSEDNQNLGKEGEHSDSEAEEDQLDLEDEGDVEDEDDN